MKEKELKELNYEIRVKPSAVPLISEIAVNLQNISKEMNRLNSLFIENKELLAKVLQSSIEAV